MLETDNMQERGQVGIGTLIVFIALVLVAAIAAGVLINTAGFLQSQAEATGEESTSQVSDNLNVLSAVGDDAASNGDINEITLTVSKAPGAGAIDLTNAEIQYVNGDSYVLDSSTSGVSINDVQGAGDDVLTNSSDRAEIVIDTTTASPNALTAGDSVTLTITTADGAQTNVVLNAPEPLETPTNL
jgi:flagellin FlaB